VQPCGSPPSPSLLPHLLRSSPLEASRFSSSVAGFPRSQVQCCSALFVRPAAMAYMPFSTRQWRSWPRPFPAVYFVHARGTFFPIWNPGVCLRRVAASSCRTLPGEADSPIPCGGLPAKIPKKKKKLNETLILVLEALCFLPTTGKTSWAFGPEAHIP
jgi:hypothetical protein